MGSKGRKNVKKPKKEKVEKIKKQEEKKEEEKESQREAKPLFLTFPLPPMIIGGRGSGLPAARGFGRRGDGLAERPKRYLAKTINSDILNS